MKYVVGFIFNHKLNAVYLIRKMHPKNQAGLLNGVGGHVEAFDKNPTEAMRREAFEECEYLGSWSYYGSIINSDKTSVGLFYSVMNRGQQEPKTTTDEQIERVYLSKLFTERYQLMHGILYLIFCALDNINNPENKITLTLEYIQ